MNRIDLAVFDMAGTTIEDSGQVPEAFTAVLATHGIEIDAAALSAVRGASKRDAIRHFVAAQGGTGIDARSDALFNAFREHLSGLFRSGGVRPVDGASATFAWLRARGIRVALNTGFDRAIAGLILDTVGWAGDVVDVVVCGDDVARGRPAPDLILKSMERARVADPRRVAAIGDTVLDLQAGGNAGAGLVIGVLSGAHTRTQLEQASHTHLIASVADLPALLSQAGSA